MSGLPAPSGRFALKEWAAVVGALLRGRQTLLLRKGGLIEEGGSFRVLHGQFFLFPTYLHEHRDRLIPEAVPIMDEAMTDQRESEVLLPAVAMVEDVFPVTGEEIVRKLRPYHIFSDGEIEKRFSSRGRPGLLVVLLRVYRLDRPVVLPMSPAYRGCRSWVDLGKEASTRGSLPVMNEDRFGSESNKIRSVL